MEHKASVVLIDDDPVVQDSVQKLLKSVGLPLTSYTTAHEFLTAIENTGADTVGCLLLDIRMPGMSGLELQQRLRDSGQDIPTIVISGHADVPMTVRAIKNGALDFLEKPYNEQVLLDRIQEGMQESERRRVEQVERAEILTRMNKLTPREKEVLDLLVSGKPNKTIAENLEISRKTLDIHRGKVLQKMEAETVADLVRMVYKARFYQPRPIPEATK
ncbi:MAG: response regulator transcription factor [Gemmataceae bacterium]